MPKMFLSSFYDDDKFISPRLVTFITYKTFYYQNITDHLVCLLLVISFHIVKKSITSMIRTFFNEIILTIQVVCRQNSKNKTQLL